MWLYGMLTTEAKPAQQQELQGSPKALLSDVDKALGALKPLVEKELYVPAHNATGHTMFRFVHSKTTTIGTGGTTCWPPPRSGP